MLSLRKPSSSRSVAVRPLSVVVADDVVEIQELLGHWLQAEGHTVACASTGRDVIQLIRNHSFDLVITDVVMPESDGWDAILAVNRIRPATRVIAISGGGQGHPADACLRVAKGVGADAVLLKPFRREQLMAAVARVIGATAASTAALEVSAERAS